MYSIEVRSGDGDTVRAQLNGGPEGLLGTVTPGEVRDCLHELLRAHKLTTDPEKIRRFFEESTPPTHTKKVA